MRHSVRLLSVLAFVALLTTFTPLARPALAATFVVNSTSDAADATPNDGVCAAADGRCTLRAAISTANTTTGSHTISFNIPTTDSGYNAALQIWTIRPTTLMPDITRANLVIDASTQPVGRSSGPRIELDGSASFASIAGFNIQAASVTIRGFVINRFRNNAFSVGGLGIQVGSEAADNVLIEDNWIGLGADGTSAAGNEFPGIYVQGGDNTIIRDNVISANGTLGQSNLQIGQFFDDDPTLVTDGTLLVGNRIGTTADGLAVIPSGNPQDALVVGNYVQNTVVGGSTAADRNIIVGSNSSATGGRAGIRILSTHTSGATTNTNTTIRGNYIGVLANGTTAGPNRYGVSVRNDTDGTVIIANVIAGNTLSGVLVEANLTAHTGARIEANLIGLNANGQPLANGNSGVTLQTTGGNAIGVSSVTITNNTISANVAHGILIGNNAIAGATYSNNLITGNRIGTASDGLSTTTNFLNGQTAISVLVGNTTIGGSTVADRNIIAARTAQAAVRLANSTTVAPAPPPSSGSVVAGNYIGVAANGTALLGASAAERAQYGILVSGGSGSNTIGPDNVIAGTSSGVHLNSGSNNVVRGNTIGFNATGTGALSLSLFGIWLLNSTGNTIGGATADDGNLIGNARAGIVVEGASGTNSLLNNTSRDHTEDGILLNGVGTNGTIVTGNVLTGNQRDGLRIDTATGVRISETTTSNNTGLGIDLLNGANANRVAPSLNSTLTIGGAGEPRATGTATGCASPGCVVEIFSSASRQDGEGPRFIARGTADPSSGAFSIDVSGCDRFLTATARDPLTNNTSQFSNPMVDTITGCAAATPELSAGAPATSAGSPRTVTPGTNISYVHTLRNGGGLSGTFSIAASSGPQGWATSVQPQSVTLVAGATTLVTVTVTVPANARGGPPPEQTTVTASISTRNASATNYSQVTQTYGVQIEPPRSLQYSSSPVPVVLDYTHTITNTGNGADTITISAVNTSIAGTPTFSYPNGNQCVGLAAGTSCQQVVRLTLPANSTGGTFTVTATAGGGTSDSLVDSAFSQSAIPTLNSFPQRDAFPAEVVSFVHTLQNTGTQTGVFTPTLTLPNPLDGWQYQLSSTTPVSLAPNATTTLTVTVTLPGVSSTGAISGTIKTGVLRVVAASGAEATANDTVRVLHQPAVDLTAATVNPAQAFPGATVVFTHTLQNNSNGNDRYTIVVTPTAALDTVVVTPAQPIAVPRGGSVSVVVRARIVPGSVASTGVQRLSVTAQSVSTPRPQPITRQDDVTVLGATVPGLTVAPGSRTIAPAGVARFSYTLTNVGNQAGSFGAPVFSLPTAQSGWSAALVAPVPACLSSSLAPGGTCAFEVDVTAPAKALAGSHRFSVAISSQTTPTAPVAQAASTIIVNPVPALTFVPDRSGNTDPGVLITYSHTVTNTGNLTDTINFSVNAPTGWTVPVPDPILALAPGAAGQVIVQVTPPAVIAAGTSGVVTITASFAGSPTTSAAVVDTTTINALDSATLTPSEQTTGGTAGQNVSFYPVLRNAGSTTISYDLAVATAGWNVTLAPTTTISLAPGATTPITISVAIPEGTSIGQDNLVTLTVRRAGTNAPTLATGLYTATTAIVGSLFEPPINSRNILPGATVVFTHTLRNPSGRTDTFTLRGLSTNGWIVSVAPETVFLNPNERQEIQVILTAPPGLDVGKQDYAYVEAQSLADPSLNGSATEIATIVKVAGVQLSPEEVLQIVPGQIIEFEQDLYNRGNSIDSFVIQATDQQGWPVQVIVPTGGQIASLGAGVKYPVIVRVTVPNGIARGAFNRITVTATSQYDPTASVTLNHALLYPSLPLEPPVQRIFIPVIQGPIQ